MGSIHALVGRVKVKQNGYFQMWGETFSLVVGWSNLTGVNFLGGSVTVWWGCHSLLFVTVVVWIRCGVFVGQSGDHLHFVTVYMIIMSKLSPFYLKRRPGVTGGGEGFRDFGKISLM